MQLDGFMANFLHFREMAGLSRDGVTLIDAIETEQVDGMRHASLYFTKATNPENLSVVGTAEEQARFTISGALVLKLALPEGEPLILATGSEEVEVPLSKPETDRFAGTHAIATHRNGEDAEAILEWISYHCETQGMTAVVILDRATPGDTEIDEDLKAGLEAMTRPPRVTVLRSHHPLGKQDLPTEAHPYCAPEAPGKDRMTIPPADPQRSPLGEVSIYEILRERFLGRADAIANIEVNDLIMEDGEGTIFDKAKAAPEGVIHLLGKPCYPWRVRSNTPVRFADHICVQFDSRQGNRRWCVAPSAAPSTAVWRLTHIGKAKADTTKGARFFRFLGLRHFSGAVSQIVPKTALIESDELLTLSRSRFGYKPVRAPEVTAKPIDPGRERRAIVTTMKNEGPFILEWIAYHRIIGFDDFLVYTNDCTDGTDDLLQLLQDKGLVQHRDNPYRQSGMKPQHAALAAALDEPVVDQAKWLVCIDVDEFINVKCGNGTLDALFEAQPDANMISMTWRLFGNADIHRFADEPLTRQFSRCAPEMANKPHVAWGFKTLFQNQGIFKKMGVHRPKGLQPQLHKQLHWVNGSGRPMPLSMYRNAWRSTTATVGYDLVQLNHYAVRSCESFLVKRDRGRVNHVDRDQGLAYWFRMNNNATTDLSIQRMLPALQAELDRLLSDPEITAAHNHSVAKHRERIETLRKTEKYQEFYTDLTGARLQKLSRLHSHFGTNVFLSGPSCVPDKIVWRNATEDFFFTVEMNEAVHN
jgi:hypothetical protein